MTCQYDAPKVQFQQEPAMLKSTPVTNRQILLRKTKPPENQRGDSLAAKTHPGLPWTS